VTLLQVHHETVYRYAKPVRFGEHRMLVRPRDSMEQTLKQFELAITPEPTALHWLHDVFGNCVAVASFDEPSEELRIVATMMVDHSVDLVPQFSIDSRAKIHPFEYPVLDAVDLAPNMTREFPQESEVDQWARRFLDADGVTDTVELLTAMTRSIQHDFTYLRRPEPGTQKPSTTLARNQGTCRDFALLMMEAARSLGFAARFVSGYLYSPVRDRENRGGGATHAWVQIYLPGSGWMEFDPTNGIVGTRDLIRVGVAREPRQARLPRHGCRREGHAGGPGRRFRRLVLRDADRLGWPLLGFVAVQCLAPYPDGQGLHLTIDGGECRVGGVTAGADANHTVQRGHAGRIEQIPAIAQIGFEHGMEVLWFELPGVA
jgi:transglutaminase-like putative cysteine protease